MGQYYKPMSLDSKEFLVSFDYGSGLKLMEHSYYYNPMVVEVSLLLMEEWNGHQVLWSGDYSDKSDEEWNENIFSKINPQSFEYVTEIEADGIIFGHSELTDKGYETLKNKVKELTSSHVFVNYDKKEYCHLDSCRENEGGLRISPIPLLLCNSNGRGGGDYFSDYDSDCVGSWAYDKVGVIGIEKVSNDYTLRQYDFYEKW